MRESLFKMFGSVRLVQEVTRSNQSSSSNGSSLVDSESSNAQQQDPSSSTVEEAHNRQIDLIENNSSSNNTLESNTTTADTTTANNNNDKQKQDQTIIILDNKQQQHMQQQRQVQQQQQQQQPAVFSCWSAAAVQPIPITSFNHHLSDYYKPRNFFSSSSSTNNNSSNNTPTVKSLPPSRRNSKYTIRQYRNATTANTNTISRYSNNYNNKRYILLEQEERQKSKSQKLLCLWPLPTVTRYIILIALLVSTLNCLNLLSLSCSAPSYVIHRLDFKNLILSPFLFDYSLPSMVLFGWNVLILGLFEESLAHMVGGTRRFIELLVFLFSVVSGLRILFGFLFSKSTGWALPVLFFSNSMHECSQGKT